MLVSQTQAAWLAGVQRGTIHYWERQGFLEVALPVSPPVSGPGRPRRLYALDDVVRVSKDRGRFIDGARSRWTANYLILKSTDSGPAVEYQRTLEGQIYCRSLRQRGTEMFFTGWDRVGSIDANSLLSEWVETGSVASDKESPHG